MVDLGILYLLIVKHFFIDFVFQTGTEIESKSIYGDFYGTMHSIKHAVATGLIFYIFVSWEISLILGIIDFFAHYHIDYVRARFGCNDPNKLKFWQHLGLDQMLHYLTYLTMVWALL